MRTFYDKILKRLKKDQEGITGLETAIILIAFVIVASVFAYVVLSAGLFSSQKAKEAVNAGLSSTMSTLEIKGSIIARMDSNGLATNIIFDVGLPAAGNSVDFNPSSANISPLVISYSDADNLIPSVNWSIQKLAMINTDNLLDPNELFEVNVALPTSGNVSIGAYHSFTLEIKPADGPVLTVQRTIPGRISQYVNLN
jgi:archaeal flagellin FlaB